ncbi:ribose-phosphate pyrophosphokinase [Bifidobacterium saguini DSM 23967]|uniref:Ribose-phosphate pyrophosphokinase n=2 Tax=Bifidobacterium saguini TaxID=762210 RepID=A0A087DCR7_9BIFI|nr:hypothetical protein [Bifidobacterium saguini]KFI93317.1 ribose-phosphate pyrophosphokinase [Bifidobacterium saguini DSM 23967]QTB90531.1 hypothetical protein BSD967_09460 [Bifidobacterium saguini]
MKKEPTDNRHEQVIEPDCHAQGIIWVGDTSQPGTLERLQHEFDAIGNIMPAFEVTGFDNFDRHYLNKYDYPKAFTLYRHMWNAKSSQWFQQEPDNTAFDQSILRSRVPVNWHCTADLCLRYQKEDDEVTTDWDSSYQFFSVMLLHDLEREHMLTDDDERREESVVALIEHRSELVLPLPAHAAISWMYYSDGAGIEISVCDGKSLRWQMGAYPEYFNPNIVLNEDDVELDIANCLDLLEQIQKGFLNPRELPAKNVPTCPVQQRNNKERNR